MSIFSFLSPKSTEKIIETASNGIVSGIDKLFFTAEEKQIASEKAFDKLLEFHKVYAEENSIRAQTRRGLAFVLVFFYLLLMVSYIFCLFFNFNVSDGLKYCLGELSFAFLSIIVTFFVPYQLTKLVGK